MKKILFSFMIIAAAAAVVIGGTAAYFSDTETSTGNTFTAGAIDLGIDNESYYNGEPNPGTSWALDYDIDDPQDPKFYFNFLDLKPGDFGEDTISIHVNDNDAWACAYLEMTMDDEVDVLEPELDEGDVADVDTDDFDGELAGYVEFAWWADDGDNVLEADEFDSVYYLSGGSLKDLLGPDNILELTLADSVLNFFGEYDNAGAPLPLAGAQTYYIGKSWCFGNLEADPVGTDQGENPTIASGFTCDGSPNMNDAMTDKIEATVSFEAIQSRNNSGYLCPEHQID